MRRQADTCGTFRSRFLDVGREFADDLVARYGSPLYLIDESGLRDRLSALKAAVCGVYPDSVVALSYKTNPVTGLLALLHEQDVYAEVVSGDELLIARHLGIPGDRTVFNGPVKTQEELDDAIAAHMLVHCDHRDEVLRLERRAELAGREVTMGLRVSLSGSGMNRFGFGLDDNGGRGEAYEIANYIRSSPWLRLGGLQVHIGTNIRDLSRFGQAAAALARFARLLQSDVGISLQWIDLGGGLAGISPTVDEDALELHSLPDLDHYAEAIIAPLLPYLASLDHPARLVFEPGRTLFEPYGAVLMTVMGERPGGDTDAAGVIVDAGLNAIPDVDRFIHPVVACGIGGPPRTTKLFGSSCRQRDVLRQRVALPQVQFGDRLLMFGTGSYSMALGHSFIRYRPPVILWARDGSTRILRRRDSFEHANQLDSV